MSTDATVAITVSFFGDLRQYHTPGEPGPARLTCHAGATVADVLRQLRVPEATDTAISRNGELSGMDEVVRDGDELIFFGPSEGG
ncbi:MAG TPA: MoaD/ThiS family protein [Tepidiformaceae bacterium]